MPERPPLGKRGPLFVWAVRGGRVAHRPGPPDSGVPALFPRPAHPVGFVALAPFLRGVHPVPLWRAPRFSRGAGPVSSRRRLCFLALPALFCSRCPPRFSARLVPKTPIPSRNKRKVPVGTGPIGTVCLCRAPPLSRSGKPASGRYFRRRCPSLRGIAAPFAGRATGGAGLPQPRAAPVRTDRAAGAPAPSRCPG